MVRTAAPRYRLKTLESVRADSSCKKYRVTCRFQGGPFPQVASAHCALDLLTHLSIADVVEYK